MMNPKIPPKKLEDPLDVLGPPKNPPPPPNGIGIGIKDRFSFFSLLDEDELLEPLFSEGFEKLPDLVPPEDESPPEGLLKDPDLKPPVDDLLFELDDLLVEDLLLDEPEEDLLLEGLLKDPDLEPLVDDLLEVEALVKELDLELLELLNPPELFAPFAIATSVLFIFIGKNS
ncbi:hypothetical protein [Clostridium sp.]|uniref:hypothetical protein n=1 Tax=Clostridium sp. TaxID=1506 RepID=UPI003463F4EE